MKNMIKVVSALMVLISIFSFTRSNDQHIGRWQGDADGELFYYTFDKEGYVTIERNGVITGGRSYVESGRKAKMTYTINYATTPIHLDIIATELGTGKEIGRMKGIVEFVSNSKMKLLLGFDSRPTEFIESDAYVLNKVN